MVAEVEEGKMDEGDGRLSRVEEASVGGETVGGGVDFLRVAAASKSFREEEEVTSSKESSVFLNFANPLPERMAFLQDAILLAAVENAAKQPLHFSYNFPLIKPKTKRMEIRVTAIMVMMMVQTMKTVSLPFEEGGVVVSVAGDGEETNQRVFISFRSLSFCGEEEEEEESVKSSLGWEIDEDGVEEEGWMSVGENGVVKLNQVVV